MTILRGKHYTFSHNVFELWHMWDGRLVIDKIPCNTEHSDILPQPDNNSPKMQSLSQQSKRDTKKTKLNSNINN